MVREFAIAIFKVGGVVVSRRNQCAYIYIKLLSAEKSSYCLRAICNCLIGPIQPFFESRYSKNYRGATVQHLLQTRNTIGPFCRKSLYHQGYFLYPALPGSNWGGRRIQTGQKACSA